MQYIDKPQGGMKGIVDPESALLSGKIKTSSLDEFQLFDKAFLFDPRKVVDYSEEIRAEIGSQEEVSPQLKAEMIFTKFLPRFFAPDRVPGWQANLHFNIAGTDGYTVNIDDGNCRIEKGLAGPPSCEISMDIETLTGILKHEILEGANQLEKVGFSPQTETELSDDMLETVVGGRGGGCGSVACGSDSELLGCPAATCGDAACGVAECPAGYACSTDIGGIGICDIEACGSAVCGAAACAGDACGSDIGGADACTVELCAVAGCGAEACAADACGVAVCPAAACGAAACGADVCPVEASNEACLADACALDFCPADACVADACAIDLIPIIPGI